MLTCGGGPKGGYIGGKYWSNPGAFVGHTAGDRFHGLCSVFVTAAFSYSGTELIAVSAAESVNPRITLPKACKRTFWLITVCYIVVLTLVGCLVSSDDPRLLNGSSSVDVAASPLVIAIENGGIKGLPSLMNAIILIAVLSVANSAVYACSRCMASMAQIGNLPKVFTYVDRKGRPLYAIVATLIFGLLSFIAASDKQEEVFTWLSALSGLSTLFCWFAINVSHIRFRRTMKERGRTLDELPFVSMTGVWGSYYGCIVINGIALCSLLSSVLAVRWKLTGGQLPELQYLYEHQTDFCIIVVIFSFIMSVFLYMASFFPLTGENGTGTKERILSVSGNTGNVIYDWFIGRELNPRVGPLDLKMFCELRPGLLLWCLINISCLHHYYLETGKINNAILFVTLAQGFYVFDGVLNEEGVLTMMDITTDGFGYMLTFGDLALVPFTYTLQARYLTVSPITLTKGYLAFLTGIMALGYYIFHSANKQKSDFRHGKLPHLESMDTKRGTKLLCDGWWGMSQHMNYFGDWLISLSWCLATGFQTPLTYYYSLYFATLLFHRQQRDEHLCKIKYGDDWKRYEEKVPYKIIPYVY